MNLYKKLLNNLENGMLRTVNVTSEQKKMNCKGVQVEEKRIPL